MLSDKELKAFIPTINRQESKTFYRDILGLKLLTEDDYAMEFDANGTLLRVTVVPELTPHPFTVLGWNIKDIAAIIKSLNKKGITCQRYPGLKQDSSGIWTSPGGSLVAWFKDPDGNLLSLTQ